MCLARPAVIICTTNLALIMQLMFICCVYAFTDLLIIATAFGARVSWHSWYVVAAKLHDIVPRACHVV